MQLLVVNRRIHSEGSNFVLITDSLLSDLFDEEVNLNINYPPIDLIRSDKRWDVNVEMRSSFALRQQVTRFESLTIHNEQSG